MAVGTRREPPSGPSFAPWAILLVALCATSWIALPAMAQVPQPQPNPSVSVTVPSATENVNANGTSNVSASVANTGALEGTVAVTVQAPAGWTATANPTSANLQGGQSVAVTITLRAPAAGQGAANGAVAVGATITDQAGRTGQSAPASVQVVRVDPVVVPPPPPPDYTPYYVAAAIVALLIAALVVLALRRRAQRRATEAAFLARETGITIQPSGAPIPYGSRRELLHKVSVKNESDRPRIALVGIAARPPGWSAAFSNPRVPLAVGESALLTLHIQPDDSVPPGAKVSFVLIARPEEATQRDERVTIEVEAPAPRIPNGGASATRSVVAHREPIAPRPVLRK
ncbi:MAG: hypothetical protein ACYDDF_11130 [Thermoplasmatota archaeon]